MSDQPDRVLTQIGPKMFLITIYAIIGKSLFGAHTTLHALQYSISICDISFRAHVCFLLG